MTLMLLLLLAQVQPLNGNTSPIIVKDEGVRQGASSASTINCSGAGITCTKSGVTMTMTVPGGGVGGGGAPVDAGFVFWGANSTGSTNERQLTAGNYTGVDVATPGEIQVDWAHGLTCTAGQAMTSGSTSTLACTSTLTASDVVCAGTCVSSGEIVSVTGAQVSSAVATATALAGDPADCAANAYAQSINASGTLTCAQVAYSQVTGTPSIPTDISAAGYWTKTTEANLSNEFAMGGLGTGLVINTTTTGVPTIMGSQTCTNQFARSSTSSGTWTCASVALADDVSGTLAQARGGTGSGALTCSAGDFITSDGTTYSCSTPPGGGGGLSAAQVQRLVAIGGP